jgi:diguanylate cyclase (GGDEF)-like protein/PAS domain S-box-containing protein
MRQLVLDDDDAIFFRTDRDGFIVEASPAIARLGFSLSGMLIGPHLRDLADTPFRPEIERAFAAVRAGCNAVGWSEFRASGATGGGRWFAVRLSARRDAAGAICGALGVLRSVDETKQLEERLFRAELTDPLTGLTNRQAWLQMLGHLAASHAPSSLAMVDIDHFKAINLHHGLAAGDRFLIDFADFLRSMAPAELSISRIGASRFGLLFAGWRTDRALGVCRELVEVLESLRCADWQGRFTITASVGLTAISREVDQTVKAGEAALRLARAKGGNTVSGPPPTIDRA